MDVKRKKEILRDYYFDEGNAGAFAGPRKLFLVLKKKYPGSFSESFIRSWLHDQDSYSLQKPTRHRFKTANVRVSGINDQWDIDLLSIANLGKYNDGIQYLLCAIDIFSRQLYVEPLKNKQASTVLTAMGEILNEATPRKIRSDKGSEFANQWFRKFMKHKGIYFFTTQNPPKANYVERVQKTLKMTLYRMMRHKRTYRYIDELDDIVANYNATPHRSLGGLAPNQVTKDNEADVWAHLYLKKPRYGSQKKPTFLYRVGDLVRISFVKQPFRRAYQEQYTTEIFKISRRFFQQGLPMYKLKDLKGRDIKGNMYQAELQKVHKDEQSLWFIEKILKKRQRKRKIQYYVQWDGFPSEYNSWVDAEDIKDTSKSGESI